MNHYTCSLTHKVKYVYNMMHQYRFKYVLSRPDFVRCIPQTTLFKCTHIMYKSNYFLRYSELVKLPQLGIRPIHFPAWQVLLVGRQGVLESL